MREYRQQISVIKMVLRILNKSFDFNPHIQLVTHQRQIRFYSKIRPSDDRCRRKTNGLNTPHGVLPTFVQMQLEHYRFGNAPDR